MDCCAAWFRKNGEIALIYLDDADVEISNQATKALEEQLVKCGHVKLSGYSSFKSGKLIQSYLITNYRLFYL